MSADDASHRWSSTNRPPSPPAQPADLIQPPHLTGSLAPSTTSQPAQHFTLAPLALALPPSTSLPHQQQPPPTPSPATHPAPAAAVLSPPTPAPSPTPKARGFGHGEEVDGVDSLRRTDWDQGEDGLRWGVEGGGHRGKGKGRAGGNAEGDEKEDNEDDSPAHLLSTLKAMPQQQRYRFLSLLVGELSLPEALVVSRRIEPRLRRDFLRELPLELAFYCLSFVHSPLTLARASQVSKHWYGLLQDERTWQDLCERHRFSSTSWSSASQSSTSLVQAGMGTHAYASIAPSYARAARGSGGVIGGPASAGSGSGVALGGVGGSVASKNEKPGGDRASYKQQFKTAYQTESNWLHHGRLIACHTSGEDGVATTLAMDEKYIVIGMANAKIHLFDVQSGTFRGSLLGHDDGVWSLVLVTPQRRKVKSPGEVDDGDLDSIDRPFDRTAAKAYRDEGQSRRASFHASTRAVPPTSMHNSHTHHLSAYRPSTAIGFGAEPSAVPHIYQSQAQPQSSGSQSWEDSSAWREQQGVGRRKMRQSDVCGSARGWNGLKRTLVVSGGCDRELMVWDADTGQCIHSLPGHTSTIRCLKVLDARPIAVTGSRDATVRVWDIERGTLKYTLRGHEMSVRCLEVAGNRAVSGSYDFTARLWDVDKGECLLVLRGHYHQIYAVAYDGERIVTGSLDSTVRVWDGATGACLAVLQGHTSLVGQLQLSGNTLVTGGSDGRVIIFSLPPLPPLGPTSPSGSSYAHDSPFFSTAGTVTTARSPPQAGSEDYGCTQRLCAHDNSVTCVQFDHRFIVSGGNDGRVKLWDLKTGVFIRELTRCCDAVWRMGFKGDKVVIVGQRGGRTLLEVVSFKAGERGGKKVGSL